MKPRRKPTCTVLRLAERHTDSEVTAECMELLSLLFHPIQVAIEQVQDVLLVIGPFSGDERADNEAATGGGCCGHGQQFGRRFDAAIESARGSPNDVQNAARIGKQDRHPRCQ
jgi:hypothetical protein